MNHVLRVVMCQLSVSTFLTATNAEMIMRMCGSQGRPFRAVPCNDDFLIVFIGAPA